MDLKRKLARLSGAGPSARPIEPRTEHAPARASVPMSLSTREPAAEPTSVPAPPRVSEPSPAGADALADLARDRSHRLAELRAHIDTLVVREALRTRESPRPAAPAGMSRALPTELRETAWGRLHVRPQKFTLDHHHGRTRIGSCLQASTADMAELALDPSLASVDLRRLLFFDLETTGLAGGTGTLAFLIGLGWFDADGFSVEQLFLPRPGEELPMLSCVAERVAAASALVSFNGKSFDWPLLRARFIINRLPAPEPPPHLDLLHCARRVFRPRLGQVRLGEVERQVLGFSREGDIDSALIPARYFEFLRSGDGEPLEPVFTHNTDDVLALAAVFGRLAAMFASVGDDDPRDHLGLARVAARAGDGERALSFATAAADHPSGRYAASGLQLAADIMRRRGDHARAAELLERALAETAGGSTEAAAIRLRLAKLYEHRLRELGRALEHASHTAPAEDRAAQQRRLARLERRLGAGRPIS